MEDEKTKDKTVKNKKKKDRETKDKTIKNKKTKNNKENINSKNVIKKNETKEDQKISTKKKTIEKELKQENENIEIISINLFTIIALFIILLFIIGVITYLYCKPSTEQNIEIAKEDTIQNNITNSTISKTAPEFNTEKQIQSLREYLQARTTARVNPEVILENYGLTTTEKMAQYEKNAEGTLIKTDVPYSNVRSVFEPYITKQFFMTEFKNVYKQSNGMTHIAVIDDTEEIYKIIDYKRADKKNKPILKVSYEIIKDGATSDEKTMNVEYTTYNGKWVISDIK